MAKSSESASKGKDIPPVIQGADETREAWITRIRYSARGYKASFTLCIKSIVNKCKFVATSPSDFGISQLQECIGELNKAINPLRFRMQELMDSAGLEKDFKDHETDLETYMTQYHETIEYVMAAIKEAQEELHPRKDQVSGLLEKGKPADAGGDATAAAAAVGKAPVSKANAVLKPELLSSENTPQELRLWLEQFQSYYATSRFDILDVKSQQAYFKQCLDKTLRFRLERRIDGRTPIFGLGDSCEAILKEEFLARYPLFNRRLTFFRSEQAGGQSMSDYVISLRQMFEEADIMGIAHEDLLLFKYLCGCTDRELRKELLKIKDPTTKNVEDFILTWEISKRADKEVAKSGSTAKASKVQRGKANQAKSAQGASSAQKLKDIVQKGGCGRCGSRSHKKDKCKYRNATCHKCGKEGHIKPVCQSKTSKSQPNTPKSTPAQSRAASPTESDDQAPTNTGKAGQLVHRVATIKISDPTPRLACTVQPTSGNKPGTPFSFEVLPDTGATVSVIAQDVARTYGMMIRPAANDQLLSADDTKMNVAGYTRFRINDVIIRAIVSNSVKDDILIGWRDLIRLGVISETFPNPSAARVCTLEASQDNFDTEKQALLTEFPDVLLDHLPTDPLKGPSMTIELRDDVPIKPRRATTCKKTPTHLEDAAQKLVDKLLSDGVIEPVPEGEISEWISPAFFVPKDGGTGVRLVTDYTCLNKYVKRPVHPFPSAADIAKGISSKAKYFCKLDATQGYHQVPLDPESAKLTTFLLPQGKFRYKRGPMGLKSTGDWWCQKSDVVIIGIPGTSKIVDDILITSETIEDLMQKIRTVLDRCRANGLTICKRKLLIGTNVSFAGYRLSADGVEADPEKIRAVKDFPSPTDVHTVRSFLGLANQLGHFLPDLAMATIKIRALLKKNIVFQWLPEHEEEFNFVKQLLTSPLVVHFFDPSLPTSLLTDASKLHGLGYALVQHGSDNKLRLIQAGSRSLAPAEKNYAPIESECLAAVWAMSKCKYFLYGCQEFKLITDHQPLIGIFRKDLSEVENRRLQRFREKVADYSFSVAQSMLTRPKPSSQSTLSSIVWTPSLTTCEKQPRPALSIHACLRQSNLSARRSSRNSPPLTH